MSARGGGAKPFFAKNVSFFTAPFRPEYGLVPKMQRSTRILFFLIYKEEKREEKKCVKNVISEFKKHTQNS